MLTQIIGISKLKKTTKLMALMLTFALCFAVPFNANAEQTTSIYTSKAYTQNSKFNNTTIENGIDISEHNGTINFNNVKSTDTSVIIVRVGCRGYGSKGTLLKDKKFDSNITNSLSNGFETGVYFYSQALTEAEATEEANFVLQYIKGYDFSLPVYYDYEFAGVSSGRLDSAWKNKTINKTQMTKNAIAFCSTIENAGYKAGIYASKSFYEDNLNKSELENRYAIWLAHYNTKTTYAGEYQCWQYSANGRVSGIDGYVDSNFVYSDFLTPLLTKKFEIENISNQAYTGNEVKPSLNVKCNGSALIKGEDYYVTFENNTNIGQASVTVTGINDYEGVSAKKNYLIVPGKVGGLKLDSRGTNSLTVSWNKVKGAGKYYVQVHRSSGWVKAGETDKTSLEITDLATASNYRIRVRAFKTVNSTTYNGSYSSEIETATSPSIPTSLATSSVKPDSFKLTWKKQTNTSYYNVYLYNSESASYELFEKVNGGANNYLVVDGLKPNTAYKFKVSSHKNSKDGELLNSEQSSVFTAYTSPNAPTISSAVSNATKKITVKFKKSSGATGYQVMWSTTKDFSSNYKSVYVTTTSTTLTTAQTKKTYYVRVRAYKTRNDKKVYSPWSKTLSVKTK